MPAFAELQPASFGPTPFFVRSVEVKGGLREALHEYPHQPAGRNEKLGRRLYTITMRAEFSTVTPLYPNAWPFDLFDLRQQFEQGVTDDLVIPTIGTIRAICIDWSQTMTAGRGDGESAVFTFREDEPDDLLSVEIASINFQFVAAAMDRLMEAAELEGLGDLFSSIEGFAADVAALGDQVELAADSVAAKVDQLTGACQLLDGTLSILDEPPHHKVAEALRDLTVASIKLSENIVSRNPISTFTTTASMAVSDIARLLYGSTERAVEILKLNPIRDAFSVPAGTELRVPSPGA